MYQKKEKSLSLPRPGTGSTWEGGPGCLMCYCPFSVEILHHIIINQEGSGNVPHAAPLQGVMIKLKSTIPPPHPTSPLIQLHVNVSVSVLYTFPIHSLSNNINVES